MKRIKDFFYNKNDILIVLIIVAAAAFIIYSRVDVIMSYPETVAKEAAMTATEEVQQTGSVETTEATKAEKPEESVTTVHITIEDTDTSVSVSETLAEAGLVKSAEKFQEFISDNDKEGLIQTGTFEIPSDATDEEILDIIAN